MTFPEMHLPPLLATHLTPPGRVGTAFQAENRIEAIGTFLDGGVSHEDGKKIKHVAGAGSGP